MAFLIPSIISGIGSLFGGISAARAQSQKNQAKRRQAAKLEDVARMIQSDGRGPRNFLNFREVKDIDASKFEIDAPDITDFRKLEKRYDNANLDRAANRTLARGRGALGVGMAGRGLSGSGIANQMYGQMTGDVLADLSQQISQRDMELLTRAQQHEQFGAQQELQSRMANQSLGFNAAQSNRQNKMQQIGMRQQQSQFNQGQRLARAQTLANIYSNENMAVPGPDPLGTALGALGGAGQAVGGGMMSMMPFIPEGQGWWGGGGAGGGGGGGTGSQHGGWYAR